MLGSYHFLPVAHINIMGHISEVKPFEVQLTSFMAMRMYLVQQDLTEINENNILTTILKAMA